MFFPASSKIPNPSVQKKRSGMALACSALVSGAKIILVLLPILLMLGVLLYFRAHSSRDLPVRGAILLILLELAYITWIAYRMDRSGYPMGRSLFCKGRYRRSVPHLVKGWRGDGADAARMLGDMLALGLDTEQNREWAVEY